MGGTLATTLRQADGVTHKMARWTNPISDFVHDIRFLNKDQSYIDDYMSTWHDMVSDWDENHQTEKFRLPMTPCYAGHRVLAPGTRSRD